MLGKVFVITIQAAPRSLLTICRPQGPLFDTTKTKPTFGAIKYENLTKINLNYTVSGIHPVPDYVFFQSTFCSKLLFPLLCRRECLHHLKLLFVASFFSHCSGLLLCRRECLHLVLIKPELVFSSLFSVTAKRCLSYKNQFNPGWNQKVQALQKSIRITSNLNKYSQMGTSYKMQMPDPLNFLQIDSYKLCCSGLGPSLSVVDILTGIHFVLRSDI